MNEIASDRDLIEALGGAAKVAALLGLEKHGGVQRVHNWKTRGIPASVKISRPDLFMPQLTSAASVVTAPSVVRCSAER